MYETSLMEDAGFSAEQRELLEITWRMLEAIHTGDSATYAKYSSTELSCYEDVCSYRIDGLEFHIALINQMAENPANRPARFDILTPRVQIYNNTGVVTYTRLMTYDDDGKPRWTTYNETRVFVKDGGAWKMVHFHRSRT
jgi:calcium/calmodulin-dependent protein kinase (CaM kinase) II